MDHRSGKPMSFNSRGDRDDMQARATSSRSQGSQMMRSQGKVASPPDTKAKSGKVTPQPKDKSRAAVGLQDKSTLSKETHKTSPSGLQLPSKAPSPYLALKPSSARSLRLVSTPPDSLGNSLSEKTSSEKSKSEKALSVEKLPSGRVSKTPTVHPSKQNCSSTEVREKSRGMSMSKPAAGVKSRTDGKSSPSCSKMTESRNSLSCSKKTESKNSPSCSKKKVCSKVPSSLAGTDGVGSTGCKDKRAESTPTPERESTPRGTQTKETASRKRAERSQASRNEEACPNNPSPVSSACTVSDQTLNHGAHYDSDKLCEETMALDSESKSELSHSKSGHCAFPSSLGKANSTLTMRTGNKDSGIEAKQNESSMTKDDNETKVTKEHSEHTKATDKGKRTTTEHNEAGVFPSLHTSGTKEETATKRSTADDLPRQTSSSSLVDETELTESHHKPKTGPAKLSKRVPIFVNTSSAQMSSAHPQPDEVISPLSLKHLRDFWSPPTTSLVPTPRQGSDSSSPSHSRNEQSEGVSEQTASPGEGRAGEGTEQEEGDFPVGYFRDRRPSAVYFSPEQANNFPWLTWESQIHPCQADLEPTNQQRLEAARDPNYILDLILHVQEVVGRGQYGTVHVTSLRSPRGQAGSEVKEKREGKKGGGGQMALKKMAKSGEESTVHALAEQRALLLARDCPFIVTLLSCFQTKFAYYLLLELAEGGSLTDTLKIVGRFPEPNVRFYSAQLLEALSFLHDKNILHRDLKMDNVLLDAAGYIRLCDFGLSMDRFSDDDQVCSPCGTLFYVAPEVLRGEPYSKTADWWSYGVLLFYMATGTLPFTGQNIQTLYIAVTRKEPCYPSFLGADVTSFTRKMLVKNPRSRPGQWSKERQALRDDTFFCHIDWTALHLRALVPPELPRHYLLPTCYSESSSGKSDAKLSASFPLDLGEITPADRDPQSKKRRSRSLDPAGLCVLPSTNVGP